MRVALAVLLFVAATTEPSLARAETAIGTIGNRDGGTRVRDLSCRDDELIVGLTVKGTDPVDGMGLLCAPQTRLAETRVGPSNYGPNPYRLTESPIVQHRCQTGSTLVGLAAYAGQWMDRFVRVYCVSAVSFNHTGEQLTPIINPSTFRKLKCAAHDRHHVSSLRVRTGDWMDAVEVRCDRAPEISAGRRSPIVASPRTPEDRQARRTTEAPRISRAAPPRAAELRSAGAVGSRVRGSATQDANCNGHERMNGVRITYQRSGLINLEPRCVRLAQESRSRFATGLPLGAKMVRVRKLSQRTVSCGRERLVGLDVRGRGTLNRLENLRCRNPETGAERVVRVRIGSASGAKVRLRCAGTESIRLIRLGSGEKGLAYIEPFCGTL